MHALNSEDTDEIRPVRIPFRCVLEAVCIIPSFYLITNRFPFIYHIFFQKIYLSPLTTFTPAVKVYNII